MAESRLFCKFTTKDIFDGGHNIPASVLGPHRTSRDNPLTNPNGVTGYFLRIGHKHKHLLE